MKTWLVARPAIRAEDESTPAVSRDESNWTISCSIRVRYLETAQLAAIIVNDMGNC
jgi:hypothetical protein